MKDYETYVNNGNPEIKENTGILNIEYFDLRNNNLPGESMDSFENSLACEIGSKSSKSFKAQSQGKSLDDVQELTNALSPSTGSIVESAGAVVTGTATVVVGASAAVIAFNATSKVQPKMKVNTLDSGSSFVHYALEVTNLDLSKDYFVVIRNNKQEFTIECDKSDEDQDGIYLYDEYVYNLMPNSQYSLSFVSYNDLIGEITYAQKTFYTLKSEEVVGYSNIDIIYNDDLTCGVRYDTTLVDDMDALTDTYVVVKLIQSNGADQGEDWELFNSLYAEDFMREEPDKYTYEFDNKVHKGTIGYVPPGLLKVELYKIGPEGEEWDGELIASTEKEVVYPLYEQTQANLIEFSGDYNLIKDIKNINVKKENLVAKITLYNENNVETKIEKEIDISDGLFDFKQLVKQDTNGYSYQIGYYKADKSFVVIKESEKQEFYGGYYGAYYDDISYNYEQMRAVWNYDDNGNETLDLTLLTDFDNYGNDDCYYKVELYKQVYTGQSQDENEKELVDVYIGTGLPTFENLETRVYMPGDDYYVPIYYSFKYTSLMNYYDEQNGIVVVEMEERDHTDSGVDFKQQFDIGATQFSIRGDGKFQIPLEANMETSYAGQLQYQEGTITLYFCETYGVVAKTVTASAVIEPQTSDLLLVFDATLPTGMMNYRITCDIPYIGMFNASSGMRRFIIKDQFDMGDVHYSAAISSIKYSINDEFASGTAEAVAYLPDGGYLAAKTDSGDDEYHKLTKNSNNRYVYSFSDVPINENLLFTVFDKLDQEYLETTASSYISDYAEYDLEYGRVQFHNEDGNYYSVMTYNNDGTVNIYCITGLSYGDSSSAYGVTDYRLNCYLEMNDNNAGGYVQIDSVMDVTQDNPIVVFKNVPYDIYDATYNIIYELVYDYTDEYEKSRQVITSKICEFQLLESNLNSLHPNGQLMGYVSYDEEEGVDIIGLTIPAGMLYDKDQMVTFFGSFDGDPVETTVKLSNYLKSSTADGDYYVFNDIDSSWVVGGTLDLKMKYNYTLTEEKYELIKNIYSGNLYRDYTITVTHV